MADCDAVRYAALDICLRDTWHPWSCRADFLPWLAWAFSVDIWDAAWPEDTKRRVIAASFDVHSHKGTPLAVRLLLQSLGFDVDITEWFNADPPADPYTFAVDVGTNHGTIDARRVGGIMTAIQSAKNTRSHLSALLVASRSDGDTPTIAATTMIGSTITILPPSTLPVTVSANGPVILGGIYGASIITVLPLPEPAP
jgi:phage tail P2-like protein